jgi:hypothetical protein
MDDKRELVKRAYRNPLWEQKINNMTESEVVALYMRLKLQGKV